VVVPVSFATQTLPRRAPSPRTVLTGLPGSRAQWSCQRSGRYGGVACHSGRLRLGCGRRFHLPQFVAQFFRSPMQRLLHPFLMIDDELLFAPLLIRSGNSCRESMRTDQQPITTSVRSARGRIPLRRRRGLRSSSSGRWRSKGIRKLRHLRLGHLQWPGRLAIRNEHEFAYGRSFHLAGTVGLV